MRQTTAVVFLGFAALVFTLVAAPAKADPPAGNFKKATSWFHCDADHGHGGVHGAQSVKIPLDSGYVIDKSQQQGSINCCGGDENGNGATTAVPPGVYVEYSHGGNGEWGLFGLNLVADVNDIGDDGSIRAWTVTATDVYCGPSSAFGKGGVNMKAYVWVKQKPK
jgi:hypothetical protein